MANKFVIEVRAKGFTNLENQFQKADAASKKFDNTQGKLRGTTSGLRRTIGALRNSLLLYTFAIAGATKGVSSLLQASSRFESLRTRLVGLTGSVKEANQAFNLFNQVAATTPFALDDVVEAGAQLEAFGADAKALIKPITDLAAFMGTTAVEAANSFGRAFAGGAGAADILRERGILNIIKTTQGLSDLSKTTLPEFRAALINTLQDPVNGIAGSTDRLSKTFEGAMSNMRDNVTRLAASLGTSLKDFLRLDKLLPNIGDSARAIAEEIDFLNDPIQNLERRLTALGVATDVLGNVKLRSEIQETRKEIAAEDQQIISLARTLEGTAGFKAFFGQARSGARAFGVDMAAATSQLEFIGNIFAEEDGSFPLHDALLLSSKNLKALIKDANVAGDSRTFKSLTEQLETVTKLLGLLNIEAKQEPLAEILPDVQVFDVFEDHMVEMQLKQELLNDHFKQSMQDRIDSLEEFVDFAVDNEGFVSESMEKSIGGMEELVGAMSKALRGANQQIKDNLSKPFEDFSRILSNAILQTEDLGKAFEKTFEILKAQIIAKAVEIAVLQTLGVPTGGGQGGGFFSKLFSAHTGGKITRNGIQTFSQGGQVQGVDNVPILAQAGEYVIKRESAQAIGLDALNQINETGNVNSFNINFNAPVTNADFVRDVVAPELQRVINGNLA
tara:strand:+ start:1319 stop:3340 length:2022 start_codon:yes stop_codon:yes gene_type:complete